MFLLLFLSFFPLLLSSAVFKAGDSITLWIGSCPVVVRNSYLYLNNYDKTATPFLSSGTSYFDTNIFFIITKDNEIVTTNSSDYVGTTPFTSWEHFKSYRGNAFFTVEMDSTGNQFYLSTFFTQKNSLLEVQVRVIRNSYSPQMQVKKDPCSVIRILRVQVSLSQPTTISIISQPTLHPAATQIIPIHTHQIIPIHTQHIPIIPIMIIVIP